MTKTETPVLLSVTHTTTLSDDRKHLVMTDNNNLDIFDLNAKEPITDATLELLELGRKLSAAFMQLAITRKTDGITIRVSDLQKMDQLPTDIGRITMRIPMVRPDGTYVVLQGVDANDPSKVAITCGSGTTLKEAVDAAASPEAEVQITDTPLSAARALSIVGIDLPSEDELTHLIQKAGIMEDTPAS